MANEFKIKKGLIVTGASGGTVVDIQGSQGQLFSVTDDLSGSIFAVSDISGVPIFDVNSSGVSYFDGTVGIGTTNPSRQLEVVSSNGIVTVLTSTTGGSYISMEDSSTTSDSQVRFGAIGNDAIIKSGGATSLTLNSSQNATFEGNVSLVTGNKLIFDGGTDATYISEDVADRLRFFVGGAEFMRFTESTADTVTIFKDTTFSTQAFSAATSSGDASSTLTTKGYVDSLITGATIYRGTWDPDVSLNSGYGNPNLNTVTQTSGYYYICSADGAATPNGTGTEPDSWNTGDWVIWNDDIGSGEWQKIDNSSVLSGVGTGQTVALWQGASSVTDSETLGNAPITVSGNNSTFAGNLILDDGSGASPSIEFINANNDSWSIFNGSQGILNIREGTTDRLEFAAGGDATFSGNVTMDDANARLKIKSGVTGTSGGVDWTFDTASTQYARIDLDYDARATTGLLIDSGYPITMDFSSGRWAVQYNGSEKLRVATNGAIGIGGANYGGSGQVLTSNGNAAPSWQTPTTGTVKGTGTATRVAFWSASDTISSSNDLYWDNTIGGLGINDTTPGSRLKVFSGTGDTSIYTVDINHVRNDANVATHAMRLNVDLSGADNTTADRTNSALYIDIDSSANGDASNEHRIYAVNSTVNFTGFSDLVRGGYFLAESNYTGAKTAQLAGVYGYAIHDAGSTNGGVSNMYGVYGISSIQDLGDVDNAFGGYFLVSISTNRGAADVGVTKAVEGEIAIDKDVAINYGTMIGVSSIIDNNEGAVPNFGTQYLFKGDYQGTKGGNAYGIYVEGDKHYFAGNVGIGTTSPTLSLDVRGTQGSPASSGTTQIGSLSIRGSGSHFMSSGMLNVSPWTGWFQVQDANNLATTYPLALNPNGGNVGIGTTSPDSKLDVVGDLMISSNKTNATNKTNRIKGQHYTNAEEPVTFMFSNNFSTTNTLFIGGGSTIENAVTSIGFYTGANNTTTQGSLAMLINSDQNVGIGTTSNSAGETNNGVPKLQVNTTTAPLGEFPLAARFTTDSDAGDNSGVSVLINSGNDRGLMISAGRAVGNRTRATLNLVSFDGNELVDGITLYMPNTGSTGATTGTNVGIGTTSPGAKLEIIDTSNPGATSGSVIIEGRRDGSPNVLTLRAKDASTPAGALPDGQGPVVRFQGFDGTDFENMGYIQVAADGQAVANGDAPSFMAFGTSGDGSSSPTERMRITNNGNVGIGTTGGASQKLHVAGNLRVTGAYYDSNNSAGTSGQVLSSTASGTDWVDVLTASGTAGVVPRWNSTGTDLIDSGLSFPSGYSFAYLTLGSSSQTILQFAAATQTGDVTIKNTTGDIILQADNTTATTAKFTTSDITLGENTFVSGSLRVEGSVQADLYIGNIFGPSDTNTGYRINHSSLGCFIDVRNDVDKITYRDYPNATGTINSKFEMNMSSGNFTATGNIIAFGTISDRKLKENIKPIDSALDKAMRLQGVTFNWKKSDSILEIGEDIGFIAQDVQKVLPELVRENKNGEFSLRHQGITPILLEAIKELKAEIEELKKQIK